MLHEVTPGEQLVLSRLSCRVQPQTKQLSPQSCFLAMCALGWATSLVCTLHFLPWAVVEHLLDTLVSETSLMTCHCSKEGKASRLSTLACTSLPADQQETTSLTQAGTAKPSQDQQEPALIPPVTFTNPRPTASATPPSNQTPTPTLTTTPTGVSEDHGAPSREGSVCLGGAIDVAARAGPGSCSPAAPASGGTNAVDTHVETSVSASSRKVSRVCLESSEPDACKPQVAEVSPYCYASLPVCLAV